MFNKFRAIKKKSTNMLFKGEGMEDLPAETYEDKDGTIIVTTTWKLDDELARRRFLKDGVIIYSTKMPKEDFKMFPCIVFTSNEEQVEE